jgi:hypothetical protein
MMPTNDERREVAARLREANKHGFYSDTALVDTIEGIIGTSPCGDHADLMTLYRLADLIEPEERTCRMKKAMKRYDSYYCEYEITWFCSECNHPSYKATKPNYCHNCGAKVVE